ncbi:MAG TPA: hypothetical protein VN043_17980 [Rhodanobacter sp.]|nr:hypothetical protein [Rhodanobacter sp.]
MKPIIPFARRLPVVVLAGSLASSLLLLPGCGKSPTTQAGTDTHAAATGEQAAIDTAAPATKGVDNPHASGLAARSGELTNPDNQTVVFLYYDLAGIAPPIDQWVEQDNRVNYARGADKAAQRASVKAAFEAGLAGVRDVGVIHLTANASLSDYDPTYGEFTVGALSPGSVFTFQALGQKVELKFDNGLTAQSWSVPKDQAQAIVDRIGNDGLTVDTTLKIVKVLPSPAGGTLVTHIVAWNLRDSRSGTTIARVRTTSP